MLLTLGMVISCCWVYRVVGLNSAEFYMSQPLCVHTPSSRVLLEWHSSSSWYGIVSLLLLQRTDCHLLASTFAEAIEHHLNVVVSLDEACTLLLPEVCVFLQR